MKKVSPTPAAVKAVMAYLGSRKSEKKAAAVRENGKLGGRPKKRAQVIPAPQP